MQLNTLSSVQKSGRPVVIPARVALFINVFVRKPADVTIKPAQRKRVWSQSDQLAA